MNSYTATDYPIASSQTWGSNFNDHWFWEYCENSGIDVWYV
jgi:hypothetical protein